APSHPLVSILGTCLDWRASLSAQAEIGNTSPHPARICLAETHHIKGARTYWNKPNYQHQSFASVEQGFSISDEDYRPELGANEDGLGRERDAWREVKPPYLYYGGKFHRTIGVLCTQVLNELLFRMQLYLLHIMVL
ncbi:hypothetical protein QTO16_28615, partial [Vibrio harveyi]|uniref:hypothetical protein n=1 Tax=Vibrio harveyi TaxID=669 RepID=UPI002F419451